MEDMGKDHEQKRARNERQALKRNWGNGGSNRRRDYLKHFRQKKRPGHLSQGHLANGRFSPPELRESRNTGRNFDEGNESEENAMGGNKKGRAL